MLVLFIRIDCERIWENWGMDNDQGEVMRLDTYYLYRPIDRAAIETEMSWRCAERLLIHFENSLSPPT